MCNCGQCQARSLNVHPWQIMWGLDSIESRLFKLYPGHPIYWYEDHADLERAYPDLPPIVPVEYKKAA